MNETNQSEGSTRNPRRVTIAFDFSFEELNDFRLAILASGIHQNNKELYMAIIAEYERYAIVQQTRHVMTRLVAEISSCSTNKDNLDVVDAIEDNIHRLKSVLK